MTFPSKYAHSGRWLQVILWLVVTLLVLGLVLGGCRRDEQPPTPTPTQEQPPDEGYPAPQIQPTDTSGPYPPPQPTTTPLPEGYPSPTP